MSERRRRVDAPMNSGRAVGTRSPPALPGQPAGEARTAGSRLTYHQRTPATQSG